MIFLFGSHQRPPIQFWPFINEHLYRCTILYIQCLLKKFNIQDLKKMFFINSPVKNASFDSDTSDIDIFFIMNLKMAWLFRGILFCE